MSILRSFAPFLLHPAIVYLVAKFTGWWLTGVAHTVILPLLRFPSSEGRVAFAFNHLALFSTLSGLISGLVAATYKHRAAQLVWIVPAIILAHKFATFPRKRLRGPFSVSFSSLRRPEFSPACARKLLTP